MALAFAAVGLFLLVGGLTILAACLLPRYRTRHPGRAAWAGIAAVVGLVAMIVAGRLMLLPEQDRRALPAGPVMGTPVESPSTPRAEPAKPGNSPVERHPGIVVPFAFLLALGMVTAMLEWSAAFLVRRPTAGAVPVEPDDLRNRLLALNGSGLQYRIVTGHKSDLELEWNVVDTSWHNLFSKIKLSTIYRARMQLAPARHELRWCEWLRTSDVFIGFRGWRPVLSFAWQLQVGYLDVVWRGRAYGVQAGFPPRVERIYDFSVNTVQTKREISKVVMDAGWAFRPVIFWFQAGRSGLSAALDQWSASVLPSWSETRLRAVVAAASYILFLGYLVWMVGGFAGGGLWTPHNLAVLGIITAVWWGLWSLLTWVMVRVARSKRKHA